MICFTGNKQYLSPENQLNDKVTKKFRHDNSQISGMLLL